MWLTIDNHDKELTEHFKGLSKPILVEYLLGLRQFEDEALNMVMLNAAISLSFQTWVLS